MLRVTIANDEVRVGGRFAVSFQRTLRIPDDGRIYPLPPGLGRLPVCRVRDFASRVPAEWRRHGGVFIPMYQREALWLAFDAAWWKPNAVVVAVGGVNAVSGTLWKDALSDHPQNYIVCPDQPWLDGINAGDGFIRQFVAMPLGMGYTVEGQLTKKEQLGGIQIRVYEPKRGRFPDRPPRGESSSRSAEVMVAHAGAAMGLGAGGKMKQKIYPDPHGIDTWDADRFGSVFVHIVNSLQYAELTGRAAPPTPVSARTYTEHGLPWFELYDESAEAVPPAKPLTKVKTVRAKDRERGIHGSAGTDRPVKVRSDQVKGIRRRSR